MSKTTSARAAVSRQSLLDSLVFHLLSGVLRLNLPLSPRTIKRFRSSVQKRDPKRLRHADAAPEVVVNELRQLAKNDDIPRVPFSTVDEGFVPYGPPPPIDPKVKLIAFYLPQYHPFPENDEWWGKGFTEWTNVGKAVPNFAGHYQPHCPIHFGYYDLRVPSVMEDQAKVAREYGIHGFSYYFYWFDGKVLMEEPLKAMLANPGVDIPFCFTWANENWTRRWDGQEHDVLIAQKHSLEDSLALLRYLAPFLADPRYIRVDGRPVFIVYRATIIPDLPKIVEAWRAEARKLGLPGLYLVAAQSFDVGDPAVYGMDAAVEFPPHQVAASEITADVDLTNDAFTGKIYDYEEAADFAVTKPEPSYKLFRTAMLSWDNTARKQNASHIMARFSITSYAQWLSALCHRVLRNDKYEADEKLVFINAWNEWAEGTHLEPDRRHGFGYLKASHDVLAALDAGPAAERAFPAERRNDTAVTLHLHYADTWPDIRDRLNGLGSHDLFVTVTSPELVALIHRDRPDAWIELSENRGRDIRPFLSVLRRLRPLGYTAVCKIHSKKSVYRGDGENMRQSILDTLLDPAVARRFDADPKLGLVVPNGFYVAHDDRTMRYDEALVGVLSADIGLAFRRGRFPAGSMYWFRPEALAALDRIDLHRNWLREKGLADGTWAHAVERIIALAAEDAGFRVEVTDRQGDRP